MKKFVDRHVGTSVEDRADMLRALGADSLDELMAQVVPSHIRRDEPLRTGAALTERQYLKSVRLAGERNKVYRSYIGQGYYGTVTPSPILRNIFENPGWYTQYTPYQAEIAQGRLEALLNFQTAVSDLTGLPIANASLLDEGTAAAEAMTMFYGVANKKRKFDPARRVFIDAGVFEQTKAVLRSRAKPLDIQVETGRWESFEASSDYFAVILQYPSVTGAVNDYRSFVSSLKEQNIFSIVAADLLSLAVLKPPGEWGADAVVGNSQRFGVPMGFGGPHAAYFSTREEYKRIIPGRIIGVSQDALGHPALRMALQTREQHIKRERATSNICTAQALLAIMAGAYAVYHGPEGIRSIACSIHRNAARLAGDLSDLGVAVAHSEFFDTLCLEIDGELIAEVKRLSDEAAVNFGYYQDKVLISIDETTDQEDLDLIVDIFRMLDLPGKDADSFGIVEGLRRTTSFMTHHVFSSYNTETELLRYLKILENRDLSLAHSMIPLGSCTMKLNAASQLIPVSWHHFAHMHPFAPADQSTGYQQIIGDLESLLCDITGLAACSLMPNSGAQGELTGLLTIKAYHEAHGEAQRNVALIPQSAHGTNPASAVMAGMRVVVVKCDDLGNIDLEDLRKKALEHKEALSALMVTYPSTHGVYEETIIDICQIVHECGGLVYMDGANMNAQVGLTSPGHINADVCHLNLHKTFAIPHGGGGPGMGPICVNEKLAPYLPGHIFAETGGSQGIEAVGSAPFGSASILLISHAYIKMLGAEGLLAATHNAILNANYMAVRLEEHYDILYRGASGRVAHEFILDLRPFKALGVTAEDIAKRLIDYGFHAPTLSFPVAGTFMIEPTESESKAELDLFCDAMIQIKQEIEEVARGEANPKNNVLVNAPHTIQQLMDDSWNFPYSREKAVYPLPELRARHKFWSPVARVDNAYGDRNLICTCPPIAAYESM